MKKIIHQLIYVMSFVISLTTLSCWVFASQGIVSKKINSSCNNARQDRDIELQIHMLYELNRILSPYTFMIKSENCMVSLQGNVRTEAEKELATDLASLVDFVNDVKNDIKINPRQKKQAKAWQWRKKIKDATSTSLVKSKLLANPIVHGLKIHVVTLNGITILSGTVHTKQEKQLAYEIAVKTKGVIAVKNKLKVVLNK